MNKGEDHSNDTVSLIFSIFVVEFHTFGVLDCSLELVFEILSLDFTPCLELKISLIPHHHDTAIYIPDLAPFNKVKGAFLHHLADLAELHSLLVLLL